MSNRIWIVLTIVLIASYGLHHKAERAATKPYEFERYSTADLKALTAHYRSLTRELKGRAA
ncbi:hypothetical protein [Pseudomonas sp. NFR16]|uniref:hypothetical protein n=1 Tax=Pseudomonas sp. NFR16 TaxID=1566248 RepID=UPI000B871002|nr:hypothetical protein [Pseudomonas sp. NFR16]